MSVLEKEYLKNTIINICLDRISSSIYDLVSMKKGVISVKDLSHKSKIKRKKRIFAIYNIKSSKLSLQLKEYHQDAEFKDFKMVDIKSNSIANSSLAIFRYEYIGQLSDFVTIQLAQGSDIFSTKTKNLSVKNINNHHYIFNLCFEPKSKLFNLTKAPGDPVLSPIQQLYYFSIYMMQTYRNNFSLEMLIEEFEISCRSIHSTSDQEIATCKLLGEYLNSFQGPIENFVIRNCLIIYSYFQSNQMPFFKIEIANRVIDQLAQHQNFVIEFKNSKYFSELLKGLAFQIIKKKQDRRFKNHDINILQFIEFIQDKSVIKDLFTILLSLSVECKGVIFNDKELKMLEEYCDKETTEDFAILYNSLAVCSCNLFNTIDYIEKLITNNIEVKKEAIIPCLRKALSYEENYHFEILAKVAISIHNKQDIINIFCNIELSKMLKSFLEANAKAECLEWYQALFFDCYNAQILNSTFREKYLHKLMEKKILSFSDLMMPQLKKLIDGSTSPHEKIIINCFEKWLFISCNSMQFIDFISFTVKQLEIMPNAKIFPAMCDLGMEEIFSKMQNDDFTTILQCIQHGENVEIIKAFKKQALKVISISKVQGDMIETLSKCDSGKLQNWALTEVAKKMRILSSIELVDFVIVNPRLGSYIYVLILNYKILKSTEISKSIFNFILSLWQSITTRSILIDSIQLIQKQNEIARKNFALFLYNSIGNNEHVEFNAILEKISDIVREFELMKETMQCLSKFYDFFCDTETVISEAAANFNKFKTTFCKIELINYTPPEMSLQYVDISLKLKNPISSSIFLAYLSERKNARTYITGQEFIDICYESLVEFETNMKIVEMFTETTKIEDIFIVFKEVNDEFTKEISLLESNFDIHIHSSVKKCAKLLTRRENLKLYCRSILDIGLIFHNIEEDIKKICESYIDYLDNYTQTTVSEFIEISKVVNAKLTLELSEDNIINIKTIFKEFSRSKALLNYLIGKKTAEESNFTHDTFVLLKENLEDSDFAEILTQEILKDLIDIWIVLLEIKDSCKTFEILIRTFTIEIEKYLEVKKKINACSRYLVDIRDYLISLESKEEYKKEIIKKIYESSYLGFSRSHPDPIYKVLLRYSEKKSELKDADIIDLKDKISLDMVKQSHETSITSLSDEFNSRFILLIDTILRIISKLNSLYDMGFPNLNTNQEFSCTQGSFDKLIEYDRKISNLNDDWMHHLKSFYCEDFWLTFLSGQEFWKIYRYIETRNCDQQTQTLLKFMDKDLTQPIHSKWMGLTIPHTEQEDYATTANRLTLIGKFLQELPSIPPRKFDFSKILQEKGCKINIEKKSILHLETTNVFDGIISIYLNFCGELPRPYQIFYCKCETTWREISAFLYRWYTSREPKLYTIIECENLTFDTKNKFCELFSELFKKSENQETVRPFAIITDSEDSSSYIPNQIRHGLKIKIIKIKDNQILPDPELKEIVKKIDPRMTVYTSRISGLGKTSKIKKLAKEEKLECFDILIAGDINYSNFGNLLNEEILSKKIVLHLGIGDIESPKYINEIIGNLSMFKLVFTNRGKYYLSEESIVCIEIENNKSLSLKSSFPYLQLVENIHLDFLNLAELEYNDKISHIGKYLYLYNKGMIDSCDLYFGGSYNPKIAKKDIQEAINYQLTRSFDQMYFNYHQLNIFFNFLFKMIESFEQGSFQTYVYKEICNDLRGSDLEDISTSFSAIRKTIITNLLHTVKEFARSYDNTESQSLKPGVENLKKWEASNHFIMFFSCTGTMFAIYRDADLVPKDIKILITCQRFAIQEFTSEKLKGRNFIQRALNINTFKPKELQALIANNQYLITNYKTLDTDQLLAILVNMADSNLDSALEVMQGNFRHYVLTVDNLVKMALIYSRSISNIPIILMGETGCGKTSLINYLVNVVLQETIQSLSVTAGTNLDTINTFLSHATVLSNQMGQKRLWLFFDEFNTSDCITHLSQIICEKKFQGNPLPANLVIIAACNPYRVSTKQVLNEVGIKKKDAAVSLVHNVKPLPDKVVEYVWDFGSLTTRDFIEYIYSMLSQLELEKASSSLAARLINHAYEYFRRVEDTSSVSLRDVSRFIDLFKWFFEIRKWRTPNTEVVGENKNQLRRSMRFESMSDELKCLILAYFHCYYLRISSRHEREKFMHESVKYPRNQYKRHHRYY